MGYMHISNLYKDATVLMFSECYALEKIHGTSAHISWSTSRSEKLMFYAGGEKHERFVALFDHDALRHSFEMMGHDKVVVFGEAYGGSQQKQAWRYGPNLKFVAFEVKIGDSWLNVPNAEDVVKKLGLEFVHYKRIPTKMEAVDAERDADSEQAIRNGMGPGHRREGVVLRPLEEMTRNNDCRVMAKHKRDEERETATPRKVNNQLGSQLKILRVANEIAEEWVTPTRMEHVLDKLPQGIGMEATRDVISAMIEDVTREGAGEFVDSREARAAIGKRTALLFRKRLQDALGK
jgi:hypothetical protein